MKALVLVAHGSRRTASNDEIAALTRQLADRLSGEFDLVTHAFLELTAPALPAVLEEVAGKGARSVRILPYFLGSGAHVSRDLPQQVGDVMERHPDIEISVSPHIGAADQMLDLLVNLSQV